MAEDDRPERGWGGRVQVSNVIHPSSGRSSFPDYVMIQMRLGDDNIFATAELTWREVKVLQARLDDVLKARSKLVRAVERARGVPGVR